LEDPETGFLDVEEWVVVNSAWISDSVSGYASKDWFEFVAECWAEYTTSPYPRKVARFVGEYLERTLQS
jgi:hypothetical protein